MSRNANPYSTLLLALTGALEELSASGNPGCGYVGLVVQTGVFRPHTLPDFEKYCVFLSIPSRPWEERRVATRTIQDVLRVDMNLLVKNDSEADSLLGSTDGRMGLFQFVKDAKDHLRTHTLNGLLDKTYDEPGGDAGTGGGGGIDFENVQQGLESGGHDFVHRARMTFVGRMQPYCHGK